MINLNKITAIVQLCGLSLLVLCPFIASDTNIQCVKWLAIFLGVFIGMLELCKEYKGNE